MRSNKTKVILLLVIIVSISFLSSLLKDSFVYASTLVDETVSLTNLYSMYPLDNYQLDFYVDTGWDWLPWNWKDGIGKQVIYGIYAITNFIWYVSLYISYATGYIINEAFNLDFISLTADKIGYNMQQIAGIDENGFMESGYYVGFLLLIVLTVGVYTTYTGMIKRQTTKAVKSLLSFVVLFFASASFISHAPEYITLFNEFSKDVSNASLDVGTKIVMPEQDTDNTDSVNLIRDSIFSIQIKQPWLILQFGTSDEAEIGSDRIDDILSISPSDGDEREDAVIDDIDDYNNSNLTPAKAVSRLGQVFFILIINIIISIFVFLLTGIMIFTQIMFIVYAMFLPISFLLSMIPTFENMSKKAILKLFNIIMARAGITLIITIAFSISAMLYSLSADSSFFLVGFLQIVTFAGIYFKLGDLMRMFSLQSSDSQQLSRQFINRPVRYIRYKTRRFGRRFSNPRGIPKKSSSPIKKNSESKQEKPAKSQSSNKNPRDSRNNTSTNSKQVDNNIDKFNSNSKHSNTSVNRETKPRRNSRNSNQMYLTDYYKTENENKRRKYTTNSTSTPRNRSNISIKKARTNVKN